MSEAGRQRVLAEKRKNVHAGVVGQWEPYEQDYDTVVSYNPYKYEHFYKKSNDEAVYTADVVAFKDRAVTMQCSWNFDDEASLGMGVEYGLSPYKSSEVKYFL